VITVEVTQYGTAYRLEGTDDQCGAETAAAVIGMAFPNLNGTIGLGLTIVASPGGHPVGVDATVSLSSLSGSWRDSAGGSGAFTYTPGVGIGGPARLTTAVGVHFRVENMPGSMAVSTVQQVNTWPVTPTYNAGGGLYNPATGTYSVPAPGLYLITSTVRWQPSPSGAGEKCTFIYIGEQRRAATCEVPSTTASAVQSLSTVLLLTTGDAIGIRVYSPNGTVGTSSSSDSTFTVTRLR